MGEIIWNPLSSLLSIFDGHGAPASDKTIVFLWLASALLGLIICSLHGSRTSLECPSSLCIL